MREAEGQATQMQMDAKVNAKEIGAKARAQEEAAIHEANAKGKKLMQAKFEKARQEAQVDVDSFIEKNRREGEALKDEARENIQKAQDYIIGRIVK